MATKTPYLSDLTRRFRAARAFAGIELKDAATELGTSTDTLRRIEQGTKPVPPPYVAWAIAQWGTPTWLLPGAEVDRDDRDDPVRGLEDLLPPSQGEPRGESPEGEEGSAGGRS
jgi:transcriptional regulator with XRE-family HTH domain